MEIFGMEKLSLVDFDGYVAATVFTGTCNFRCGFCHNGPLVTDVDSLKIMDNGEIFSYLEKRRGVLDGVCITGGEPTLQKDLPDFCLKLKNMGLKVKLDTNGTNPDMVKLLDKEKLCDYFAMDIKNDKENYAKTIGFSSYNTAKIEKTVDFFLSKKEGYEFRTTIINEFHSAENIENIGKWITGANKYFMQKFKEVDTCIEHGMTAVPQEKAELFLEIIKKYIPSSALRGY